MTSGSHVNPAVTIGVLIRDGIKKQGNVKLALIMIIAQIAGGFMGCLIAYSGTHYWETDPELTDPQPDEGYHPSLAILEPHHRFRFNSTH